jgi:hypothetical protein
MAAISSDRFTAAQLAKEGVELVRNLRDSVFLSNNPADWGAVLLPELAPCWGIVVSGVRESSGGCEIDFNDVISPISLPPAYNLSGGRYLKVNGNGFYDYEGSLPTKFKRRIIVNAVQPFGIDLGGLPINDMLDITVEVTWSSMEIPLRVYEQLYNWRY